MPLKPLFGDTMYRCNTTWYDSRSCKLYEEGVMYEIDTQYMASIGSLKYFTEAENKPKKTTKKGVEK